MSKNIYSYNGITVVVDLLSFSDITCSDDIIAGLSKHVSRSKIETEVRSDQ